jgi:hypothetical protein
LPRIPKNCNVKLAVLLNKASSTKGISLKKHQLCAALLLLAILSLSGCGANPTSNGGAQNILSINSQKCFGGSGDDSPNCIRRTNDGGYIIAGHTDSNDGDVSGRHSLPYEDIWVVKVSSNETLQWQKCLGGSNDDCAFGVEQTIDGGYIIGGQTSSVDGDIVGSHGSSEAFLVKLSSTGTIEWAKCYGGSGWDGANSVVQSSDGGYVLCGFSTSNDGDVTGNHGNGDAWVAKLSSSGDIEWEKCYGGSGDDYAEKIKQTADGGYIFIATTTSTDEDVSGNHGDYDIWVVKLNLVGTIEWQRCCGGISQDIASNILLTADGGYLLSGNTMSNDGDVNGNHQTSSGDAWLVKLNSVGTMEWQRCYGGNNWDYANEALQMPDGEYFVSGVTDSHDGDISGFHGDGSHWDAFILRLNANGGIVSSRCFGGTQSDGANSICLAADGSVVFAAYADSKDGDVIGAHGSSSVSDVWLVKLNK